MKLKPGTKHLDNSSLTDKEKRHSVALVATAGLLLLISLVTISEGKVGITFAGAVGWLLSAGALGIICFVWGYTGAMEDERSGNP